MVRTIGQAMFEEAQISHAQKTLFRQGRTLFSALTEETEAAIKSITDLDRLDRMLDRIHQVKSWAELLETA